MSPEMSKALEAVVSAVEKNYGKGAVMRLDEEVKIEPDDVVSSGSIGIDCALGIGGYPKGRIVEIYGPESCIAGDSFLQYEIWSNNKKTRRNHKGGSIRRLYERFNNAETEGGPKQGRHLQLNDGIFYVKSVDDEGRVIRNEVLDVVKTGKKKCFKLTTETGERIISTAEHKYLTPSGFLPLSEMKEGDTVFIHNNTRLKGRKKQQNRPEIYVKYHPKAPTKVVKDKSLGKDYLYHRIQHARFSVEAFLNGMSEFEYVNILNTKSKEEINKLSFLSEDIHVHHKDEDFHNNDIDNLELIDPSEHGRLHANDRIKNLSFITVPDKVISIEEAGEIDTYDLKCMYPYNNYIADNIVVHNSGKTTLTLHAVAETQKAGGKCLFIDAEHALDVSYAARLGVDIPELLVSQPDSGEQALEIADMFARSGEIKLIVIDSVAALVPKKELEGDMGDSHIGLQARMMSQAMRKITGAVNKTGCIIIFINQIRMKIGVMFGCFSYDTLVNFTDGRSIPIGEVVDNEIDGDVYCVNEKTGEIEEKPIIMWHDNGRIETKEDFIHIQTESINGRGRFGFTCTPNHEVFTTRGWVEAKDLSFKDELVSKYEETINGTYGDFLRGMLVGDSHLSVRYKNTAALKLQDNENQEYINWKLDKISPFVNMTEKEISRGLRYDSDYSYEFAHVKKIIKNRNPRFMLEKYSDLSLAMWIMDDGNLDLNNSHRRYRISVKRFKNDTDTLQYIQEKLKNVGLDCTYHLQDGSIWFKTETTDVIAERICKYVPECMQYKLPEEYRNRYEEFTLENSPVLKLNPVEIKEIRNASNRQMRNTRKFDITVKDNHNYMVGGKHNGVLVHNSPETTTGGGALKYAATQRIDIRRIGAIKERDEIIGNRTRVKIVKNKKASPFKEYEFDIRYGIGIDKYAELIDLGADDGVINKSGSWYSYGDTRIGQGKGNAIQFLKDDPEITEKIRKEILSLRGLLIEPEEK